MSIIRRMFIDYDAFYREVRMYRRAYAFSQGDMQWLEGPCWSRSGWHRYAIAMVNRRRSRKTRFTPTTGEKDGGG